MKYLFILIPFLLFFIASTSTSNAEKLKVKKDLKEKIISQPNQPDKKEVKPKKMRATTPIQQKVIREWLLLIVSIIGVYLLWRRAKSLDETVKISEKTADDRAFLDAIRMFESTNTDSRIGAIVALERIAIHNPDYKKQIFKIFFGFIRNNSNEGRIGRDLFYVRPDIFEIMEILKRNPFEKRDNEFSLNGSYLAGFEFRVNDFKRVSFRNCSLNSSAFRRSDFMACNFGLSKLQHARFVETDIQGLIFIGVT